MPLKVRLVYRGALILLIRDCKNWQIRGVGRVRHARITLLFMKSVLLVQLVFLPTLAFAQATSGGADLRNSGLDYARVCGPSAQGQPNQYAGACNIWLTGVLDGLQAYNSNLKVLPLFDASNVTVGQVSKLVLKYVVDHPDKAKLPAAAVVLGALVENYPHKEAPPAPTK